jgi:hypothetical protein
MRNVHYRDISIHLLIHLGCFHLLAVTKEEASVNTHAQVSVQPVLSFFLHKCPAVEWLGHIIDVYLNF